MSNAVRNADGIFINTEVFREEAKHFDKYGYYCPDPPGSLGHREYWLEQRRRRKEGYTVGGVHITGDHYNYLNFSQIKMNKTSNTVLATVNRAATKKPFFPNFWDGDYDYFHNIEIARYGCTKEYLDSLNLNLNIPQILTGGRHLTVGKARRKGFSYKNGSILVNRYDLIPDSINIVGAYDKKYLYPEGTMQMANDYINFITANTAWGKKRDFVNKIHHKKASYKSTDAFGMETENGYKSVIMAITFQDNPDAARGKDGTIILLEEAGKFPNLKASLKATLPALKDGAFVTGQIIIFGTGSGDEDGESDWEDFAEIFYSPDEFDMQVFLNKYDEEFYDEPCSYFFPDCVNLSGYMDEFGNSKKEEALKFRFDEYENIKNASKKGISALNGYLQEYANKPSEAFLVSSNNSFPTRPLKRRYTDLIKGVHDIIGLNVYFEKDENNNIVYKILKNAEPLLDWKPKTTNYDGNVIIYEPPIENSPIGMNVIGFDPVRETSKTDNIVSVNAAYMHKGHNNMSYSGDKIIGSYIGRPNNQEEYYNQLILWCEAYNAIIMHENEVIDVRNYFRRKKKLHLLAPEPIDLINLYIEKSTVARQYGCHMVEKLKIAGLRYYNQFLTDTTVDGRLIAETIPCPGLIEETLKYNRIKDKAKKANYDRIMAMLQIMFYRANEDDGQVYKNETTDEKVANLYSFLEEQYK